MLNQYISFLDLSKVLTYKNGGVKIIKSRPIWNLFWTVDSLDLVGLDIGPIMGALKIIESKSS